MVSFPTQGAYFFRQVGGVGVSMVEVSFFVCFPDVKVRLEDDVQLFGAIDESICNFLRMVFFQLFRKKGRALKIHCRVM